MYYIHNSSVVVMNWTD